jgi:uncharacterized protein (TIGR00299 family) protein
VKLARMRTLLIEPFGGMAGDMFLAALLDLGREAFVLADLEELARALVPEGCELELHETSRGSLRALTLEVRTPESVDPPARHLADLVALIERSPLGPRARARATRVLEHIAAAEARVHGTSPEAVHFHEVGAVDTLVDVCGAALALERLEVERVVATRPYVGGGTVECAHGTMPVPAPGTAALLAGRVVRRGPGGERVTPTGAALLVELVDAFEPVVDLASEAEGVGAGSRDPAEGPPNLLRVSLCAEPERGGARAEAWLLECNLDDTTGEETGFLLEELRRAGALEAWSAPVQMKKDRPGAVVSALARAAGRADLERVLLAHSPTLGLRWSRCERLECPREELALETQGRRVRVKVRRRPGQPVGWSDLSAEHDDLAALARATGRSLRELEHELLERALERLRADGPPDGAAQPR